MKKCPVCKIDLIRTEYEQVIIHHCSQCNGYLLPQWKLESIEHNTETPLQVLKQEASTEFSGDTKRRIKCPKCYFLMYKFDLVVPYLTLQMDVCERCELIWLDGGELALLQILYEASDWHKDSKRLQRRTLELAVSPERLMRLEKAIQQATGPQSMIADTLENVLDDFILFILTRHRNISPRGT